MKDGGDDSGGLKTESIGPDSGPAVAAACAQRQSFGPRTKARMA
jgi:hypothetical protein